MPISGVSYPEVLEAAVDSGRASNEAQASAWLHDQLHLSLARSDLPVIAQAVAAWRAADSVAIARLNAWILQTRESHELRAQTEQMCRSLLEWLRKHTTASAHNIALLAAKDPSYPFAFALAAASTELPMRACLLAYAFGWAENMTQAAIKSVLLGQSAGQRILSALAARIPAAVKHALALTPGAQQAFSPILAILSARKEVQYSRLSRS